MKDNFDQTRKPSCRAWGTLCALVLAALVLGRQAGAQTAGLDIRLDGGQPSLVVTGGMYCRYVVQYATDLTTPQSWHPLMDFVVSTNPCSVADSIAADAQRFYRVILSNPALTVTDAQVQDMCSRMSDYLTLTNKIPEGIVVGGGDTNVVTAAELEYLMVKWLRSYRSNTNKPPATVTITRGTHNPMATSGIESGQIYLADILAVGAQDANAMDATSTVPNCSTVAGIQYTTKAMLWLYARTINWYQDHAGVMPNYATVKAVSGPDSWPNTPPSNAIRVALFTDPVGGSTAADCVNVTIAILATNSGFYVSSVTGTDIQAGVLTNYDVVMFPGGGGTGQAQALGQAGCAKVEQFVSHGGGYIGTCAGAYLAALGYNDATSWLQIVDAQVIDVDHWARGTGMAQIHLLNTNHVILAGFPEYFLAQYINGPLLGPGGSPALPDYEQGAVFVSDIHDNAPAGIMPGTTCMTTSTYQSGRCVLFSFHPELTAGLEQMDVRAVKWAAGKL
jgi:hypothetical protein